MNEAHIDSVMALGQPFQCTGAYDFARQVCQCRPGDFLSSFCFFRL